MGVHGHNFPEVSLVGVLRAEEGLFIPSYKAAERSFHLLTQAAGRAGRKTERGKVFFQTSLEEHYVIKYALTQDYESFYKEEIALRKAFLFPPFVRLTVIRVEGIKEEIVKQESIKAKEFLEKIIEDEALEGIWVIGPSPCPFRKLKGFYRWHILIKSESYKKINQVLRSFLGKFRVKGLKITYDIDPEDLL
jgi:primosomal protein N' (replication factor Y)